MALRLMPAVTSKCILCVEVSCFGNHPILLSLTFILHTFSLNFGIWITSGRGCSPPTLPTLQQPEQEKYIILLIRANALIFSAVEVGTWNVFFFTFQNHSSVHTCIEFHMFKFLDLRAQCDRGLLKSLSNVCWSDTIWMGFIFKLDRLDTGSYLLYQLCFCFSCTVILTGGPQVC